jgi:hypothetical protein
MKYTVPMILAMFLPASALAQTCGVMEFGGTGELITRNIVVSLTSLTASEIESNGACEAVEQFGSTEFEDGCPGDEACLAGFVRERELDRVVTGAVHYDGEEFSLRLRLYHSGRGRFTGSIQGEVPADPGQRADHVIRSAATLFGVSPSTADQAVAEAEGEAEDETLAQRLDLPPPDAFEMADPEREYDDEPTEDEELDAVLQSLSLESLDGFAGEEEERGRSDEEEDDHEYDEEERYSEREEYVEAQPRPRDRSSRDRRDDEEEEEEEPVVEDGLALDTEPIYADETDGEEEFAPAAETVEERALPLIEDAPEEEAAIEEAPVERGERPDRTAARVEVPNVQGPPRAALRVTVGFAHFQNPSLDLGLGLGIALRPDVWLDAEVGGWLSRSSQDSADEVTHAYFLVPAAVGVVFKKPDGPVRPYVGFGALLFSYFVDPDSGKPHVAPGARGMGGAEFSIGRKVGLVVNGSAGFAYAKDIAALSNEAGYRDAAFVGAVRAGLLIRF